MLQFIPEKNSYQKYFSTKTKTNKKVQINEAEDTNEQLHSFDSQTEASNLTPPSIREKEEDSNSNPTQNTPEILKETTLKNKSQIIVPNILKKPNTQTHTAKQVVESSDKENNTQTNKRPTVLLPQILKQDKSRLSKSKVLVPQILKNQDSIQNIQKNLTENMEDKTRRSSRIKKPPDKFRF